ncbi:hypothetical protein KIH74_35560 [Kineosporia sp. J2-2]|uniref:DUF2637 domain-containing protein n=1 Tax=Kineosporia corallincola TaxID=2835133 RepID=A0ABS5TU31_9ACTN|nr:hypothetical protein [Kineosporia corallincola]MBT0774316.1 hypothetical protein [Kineosporia corallincola]
MSMSTAATGLAGWVRADPDRACAALVLTGLGAISLVGSATHVLHVGARPEVNVTGWMVLTVAGSLEVLAAYAAWEVRRRNGFNRLVPALVLILTVVFIVLANLAAADPVSWAAHLPWAEAFAVAPPVSFLCVAGIAETRGWKRARRTRTPATSAARKAIKSNKNQKQEQARRQQQRTSRPSPPQDVPAGMTVRAGERRTQSILRWLEEGHTAETIRAHGPHVLGVSAVTVKRDMRGVGIAGRRRGEPVSAA